MRTMHPTKLFFALEIITTKISITSFYYKSNHGCKFLNKSLQWLARPTIFTWPLTSATQPLLPTTPPSARGNFDSPRALTLSRSSSPSPTSSSSARGWDQRRAPPRAEPCRLPATAAVATAILLCCTYRARIVSTRARARQALFRPRQEREQSVYAREWGV